MVGEDDKRPTPDPTVLTTEQLLREVDRVKELMTSELAGLERVFAEQFHSVETQFGLIERQRVEQKSDTEKAVQAALSAAKEAVKEQTAASDKSILKSETATSEQLKQLTATFAAAFAGQDKSFSDLKDRVVAIESTKAGGRESAGDASARRSQSIALMSVAVAAVAIVVTVVVAFALSGR